MMGTRHPIVSVTRFLAEEQKKIRKKILQEIYQRVKASVREGDVVSETALRRAFQNDSLFSAFKKRVETPDYREAAAHYIHQASEARKLSESKITARDL
jgi:hypothetical protein